MKPHCPVQITTKTYDARGQLLSATDPGGTISYTYRTDGQPSEVKAAGVSTTFEYDAYGRQTAIVDPSAGRQRYTYDAMGNRASQTDAENRTIGTTYNNFGQPLTSTYPEFTLTYAYNPDYTLASVTSTNGTAQSYTYDYLGRIKTETERIDQTVFTKTYNYENGKVSNVTYSPISQPLNYSYNQYGYLSEMKLGSQSVWKLNTMNHFGQPLNETLGNGVVQTYAYTADGLPNELKATKGSTVLQRMQYGYDAAKGLLTSRTDATRGLTESFTYDNLPLLKTYGQSSNLQTVNYAANGNINHKTDAGNFTYNVPEKPYAVGRITTNPGSVPLREQDVTYTSFRRPATIEENGYRAEFTYLPNHQRAKMRISYAPPSGGYGSSLLQTRYYLGGNYEKEIGEQIGYATTERIYLGGTAYNAPAVLCNENGTWKLNYLHRDRQGSITQISDENGSKIAEYNYDAWGRLRNPQTLAYYGPDAQPSLYLNRGYTGHEHLPWFGLINMNARLYDPVLGRFLAPDPYVQLPDFTQSFNRYTYCLNNPLNFVDKSGNKWNWWIFAGFVLGIIPPGTAETIGSSSMIQSCISGTAGIFEGFSEAKRRFRNTWDMSMGLFQADESKSSLHQFWQILSRNTFQQPFTWIGYGVGTTANNLHHLNLVEKFHGATIVVANQTNSAVSIGGFIFINPKYGGVNYDNTTLLHEYGHFLQTRHWGPLSIVQMSAASLVSAAWDWRSTNKHDEIWTEADANARARDYFKNNLTETQRNNFNRDYPNQQYYDWRMFRSWLYIDYLALLLMDFLWSE